MDQKPRKRVWVQIAMWALHFIAAIAMFGMFLPHIWAIATGETDPRGRILGHWVVLHEDQSVFVRTPANAEYEFNWRQTYYYFIPIVAIWAIAAVAVKLTENRNSPGVNPQELSGG